MDNFNGFLGSGIYPGYYVFPLFLSQNPDLENRLAGLDESIRDDVLKHINEFQSKEEMECYINHITNKRESIT